MIRQGILSLAFFSACTMAQTVDELIWQGDFESADLASWSFLLHPEAIAVTKECAYDGSNSAKITLSGDDALLWHGNPALNRAELSYTPKQGSTFEGKTTWFGFSLMVKESLLPIAHEIGYWESSNDWQQRFRFSIVGEDLVFQKSDHPLPFFVEPGFVKAGQWRDLALEIHWSTDDQQGRVRVWLDGKKRGEYRFATLHQPDAAMFTQMGLLRAKQTTVETLYIDNAREARSLSGLLSSVKPTGVTCQ